MPSNRPMKSEICSLASELMHLVKNKNIFDGGAEVVISSCPQDCRVNTEPVCGEAIRVCIDWVVWDQDVVIGCVSQLDLLPLKVKAYRKHHSNPRTVTAILKRICVAFGCCPPLR